MHYNVGDLVVSSNIPQRIGIITRKKLPNFSISSHGDQILRGCQYVYYVLFSGEDKESGPYYASELRMKSQPIFEGLSGESDMISCNLSKEF